MEEMGTIEDIAKAIGHKRIRCISETKIRHDGTSVDKTSIRIQSYMEKLPNVHIVLESERKVASKIEFQEIDRGCEHPLQYGGPDQYGYFFIYFKPYLSKGKEAEFTITEESFEPLFAMTAEELLEYRQKNPDPRGGLELEYIAQVIGIPTEYLEMVVEYPAEAKLRIEPFCRAFRDRAGSPNAYPPETDRMESTFKRSESLGLIRVSTSVRNPIFGVTYVICWGPGGVEKRG